MEALNERPVIVPDDEARDDFVAALDVPAEPDPAVKARYARRDRWEPRSRLLPATTFRGLLGASVPPTHGFGARQG